ncbi:ABC transporter substrate-binding protein [Pigmentiphaga soli]|uniref:Thiamine pyrimidine synthase n=1 Tax=Pigmentiphaga soli TaxID=1007095 RepID=A0ABP8GZJ9_9BURK
MRLSARFRIAALLLGLCPLAVPAQQSETFTVRDSWTPSGLQAGWHWGLEKAIFARHGVTVRHEDGNGSTTTVQLVSTGQIDVGYTDLSVMAIARGKGAPIVSIAGLIKKTSLGVFVPKGSGMKTPKDLEGKEVIYTATSFEAPFIDTFLRAGGASRDKVNLVSVDASAKVSTYVNGRGDAMITSLPFGAPYVQGPRPSDTISFGDYGLVLPSYGLVVREQTLKSRREGLRRLTAAFLESWQQIVDGGESAIAEAADIMIRRRPDAKLDRAQTMASIREHIPYFKTEATKSEPLGIQSEQDWKAVIRSLEEAGLIPAGSRPAQYYTNDLIGSGN